MNIGSAQDLSIRPGMHLYPRVASNSYFRNALQRYGVDKFALAVIKTLGPVESFTGREI